MSEDDGVAGSALGASLDAAFFGYNSLLLGLVLGHDSGLLDGFLAGPHICSGVGGPFGDGPAADSGVASGNGGR